MRNLNIIGAGRVGRTLAALWIKAGTFAMGDVLAATANSARSAVIFIGAGNAVERLETMHPAEVWMLTPPDGRIAACCAALAASGLLREGDVVFHCSGALSSKVLEPAARCGASVASVHPLKTFAEPKDAILSFAGTYCTAEGAAAALSALRPAFEAIGARVAEIDAQFKTLYHAASVIVCNYLVALMETGLRCYEAAGIARGIASAMMEPLVRETVDNLFKLGTVNALTGPIARGDETIVARHAAELARQDVRIAALYRALGMVALELAHAKGEADAAALDRIHDFLCRGE